MGWSLQDVAVMHITARTMNKIECSWREVHKAQIIEYIVATLKCTGKTGRRDVENFIGSLQPIWQKDAADLAYLTLQKLKKDA